jgi:hypothetical protein
MQNFLIYSNIATGAYLLVFALILNTGNLRSAVAFKVIPFVCGAALIFNGLKLLNLI